MKKTLKINEKIKALKGEKNIVEIISQRMREFNNIHEKDNVCWFRELCFCLLTANFTAQGAINICQKESETCAFTEYSAEDLSGFLKEQKHRFPNARAGYIYEARKYSTKIKEIITGFVDEKQSRQWLVKNIKGLGYKEASHFLRNVGYKNVAIIDRHILKVLYENKIISEIPTALSMKKYIEIEKTLEKIADDEDMNLAELDFYLWYMKTGKVLK